MNMTFEVDSRELQAAFKRAPEVITSKLDVWIKRTALNTERAVKQNIPPNIDTGRLQSSVQTRFSTLQAEVRPTAKYAYYVHQGRKPGGKLPPIGPKDSLTRWATKRGIPPFLVARAIARKGTKANPFMEKAYKQVKPTADFEMNRILNDIVGAI